jgi:hypothetical protein
MLVRTITAGTLAGALAVGLAAPVVAKGKPDDKGPKVKGTTSVMLTKSVKTKLSKDGIKVDAVAPGKKKNKVKFVFPATQTEPQLINHTGGLSLVRADASLTATDFVFDLEAGNVDVTVPGLGVVEDVFDLAKVKINKKTVTAKLNVAPGKAELLNGALKTTLFKDGMFFAKSSTKF